MQPRRDGRLCCVTLHHTSQCDRPPFPFHGRQGIIEGKAGHQTQRGEAAKNWSYYREVRLLFRVSEFLDLVLFYFFVILLLTGVKIYFLQSDFSLRTIYDILSSSTIRMIPALSLFVVSGFVSRSLRHSVLRLVAQRQRV